MKQNDENAKPENDKKGEHDQEPLCATDPDRTIAEDEQNSNTSGNISNRFEKLEVSMKMVKGKRFGLGIILVHQRILVCKVEDESLVSGALRVGDQILEVDHQLVKEKSKCRKLLMNSLNKKGEVHLNLIRPKTADAMSTIMEEIAISQKPSVENIRAVSPTSK